MSTSDFAHINRSCLNNSSSKQLFSFCRQQRFRTDTKALTSSIDFLETSSQSSVKLKGNSFSRSKKELVFENEEQYRTHPPPGQYNQDNPKHYNSGITIALKLKPNYYPKSVNSPGPGAYSARSFDKGIKLAKFTKQRRQLRFPLEDQKGKETPGPYLVQTQKLKSILSNYRDLKQTKIYKKTEIPNLEIIKSRLRQNQEKMRQKLNKLNIKHKNSNQASLTKFKFNQQRMPVFDKQIRKSYFDAKTDTPSGAQYRQFSEFASRNKPDAIRSSRKIPLSNSRTSLQQRTRTLPASLPKK